MAKKGPSEIVALVCSECKRQNYVTTRNKLNAENKGKLRPNSPLSSGKLTLKKYCKWCRKYQIHKETTKLK